MKRPTRQEIFSLALSLVVGLVFVTAGVEKIRDPIPFANSIATFRIAPPAMTPFVTLVLPPFEILVGMLLVIGRWRRAAALATILLLTLFLTVLLQAWARGLPVDCGCFGSAGNSPQSRWLPLARDAILLAAAIHIWRLLSPGAARQPSPPLS